MVDSSNKGGGAVSSSRANRRRGTWRRMQQQESRQRGTQNEATEAQPSQQLRVPNSQRDRGSRRQDNAYDARQTDSFPVHSRSSSWSDQSYIGRPPVNVPASVPSLPYMDTVAREEVHTHLTIDGIGYLQWQSSTTYSSNGIPCLVETSSVLTRTESTGWDSMGYSSPMEATTPMSEPPELWPSYSGGYNFVGAQFEYNDARPSAGHNDSIGLTPAPEGSSKASGPRPIIIVSSDSQVDIVESVAGRDNNSAVEMAAEIDLLSSLPFDMSRADLDWVKDEDWVNAIPSGLVRAWTFPGADTTVLAKQLPD